VSVCLSQHIFSEPTGRNKLKFGTHIELDDPIMDKIYESQFWGTNSGVKIVSPSMSFDISN